MGAATFLIGIYCGVRFARELRRPLVSIAWVLPAIVLTSFGAPTLTMALYRATP